MLRVASLIEATTYLILVAAVVLHRLAGTADLAPVLGPAHGVLYLGYLAVVVRAGRRSGWPFHETVTLLAVAAVPLGGYYVAGRMLDRLPAGRVA